MTLEWPTSLGCEDLNKRNRVRRHKYHPVVGSGRCSPLAYQCLDEVIRRYLAGDKLGYIAESVGVSSGVVRRWLDRAGALQERRATHASTVKARVIELYLEGETRRAISARTGVAQSTIYRIVKESGAIRSQGDALALKAANRCPSSPVRGKQGAFHSKKMNRWIPTGSRYEYIRLFQLENDPSVIWFDRCADRIPYFLNGKARRYIPDFVVRYEDGSAFVEEVKPVRFSSHPTVLDKCAAATTYYKDTEFDYRMVTEAEIGQDVIDTFDWTGVAHLSEVERAKRKAERYRAYGRNMTPEQRQVKNATARQRKAAMISEMSDSEKERYRQKKNERQRAYASRKRTDPAYREECNRRAREQYAQKKKEV